MFFDMKGGVDELSDGQGCREERKDTTIKVIQELGHEREVRVCQDRENGGGKLSQAEFSAEVKKQRVGSKQMQTGAGK